MLGRDSPRATPIRLAWFQNDISSLQDCNGQDCDADQESTGIRLQKAALIRLDLHFNLMSAIFT